MLPEVSSWLVWLLPLISSIFVPLIARLGEKPRNYFVVAISLVTAALAFSLIPAAYNGETEAFSSSTAWISSGINAGVFIDPLSVLFAALVAFFGVIIAIYSLGYMKGEEGLTRYYFFLLLFIGSMIGLVISDNFLQMFIFWEMVGLCSYSLISFWYKRPESVRAGAKVFLMTRIGDISLLGAIGLLYASLGSFSFRYTIANIAAIPAPTLTAIAFLTLGGAIAKSAQLPLHTWLYSAMEAPTSVSALLHAATMVKAGIYLIARLILILGPSAFSIPMWLPTVAWIGVLTAFIGATLALYTPDIKGVLAYSTISQLGFMMAALGTVSQHSDLGLFASLFHMISHAFFERLGFLLAGGIIHALGTRDMRLMGGLRKAMPITFGLSIIMVLTTSGLPPFAAFFSKGLIITSLTEAGNIWQVLLIYVTAALTFTYSLRFMTLVFMGKEADHLKKLHVHEAPKIMLFPAAILAVLCVAWGFVEPWLKSFMQVEAEASLLGAFFSLETPVFFAIIAPAGLIIYLTYYKNSEIMSKLRSSSNPLKTVLSHGYFFDDLYEKVTAKAIVSFSNGVRFVEKVVFNKFPQIVAWSVIVLANAVHRYLDILADNLLTLIAHHTLRGAAHMRKVPSSSLQHYIAAALLGFILIIILLIITVGV
ncbi:MAG: NADH-quinone oxidoreductase subunit L [Candidatus Bathyarchaeota archaeon]|nr:NADH-quinone oxidoreductase subunit L [Candidatus Bathyarchaeota archaeon]